MNLNNNLLFIALIFFSFGCTEKLSVDTTKANYFFHVKEQGAYLPVWVRGNTSSSKILLYIQGGPGLNTIDFATIDYSSWENTLENDFAIAYYDQRGTGNAQGNFDLNSISLNQYLIDLRKVVQAIKAQYPNKEVYLFGHSFGGWLAYLYALNYQTSPLVDGLVTANAPFTTDHNDIRWNFRHAFLDRVATNFIEQNENIAYWQEVQSWLEDHLVIDEREEYRQWNRYVIEGLGEYEVEVPLETGKILKAIFASSINAFPNLSQSKLDKVSDRLFEDQEGLNLLEQLNEIRLPILMVTGSYDDIAPPEEFQFAFEKIGSINKFFEILPDAGHDAMLNQPELFRKIINEFLF